MINLIRLFLIGIAIGMANVIPGVSGGTLAVVFNVYDQFINAITFNLKKICIMPHFCQIFLLITEFLSASKILYHCVLARILLDKNSVIIHIFVWKNMFSPS